MTELWVKVETGQEEFEVERNTYLQVKLRSEPENGRANQELLRELEKRLGEKPGIISGHKSARKKITVDMDEKTIYEKLGV